jgi:hypothetical protein
VLLIMLLPLLLLYFVPTTVALSRGRQVGTVLVLNLFFGWTLLAWVGALAIAASSPPHPPVLILSPFGYPPYQFPCAAAPYLPGTQSPLPQQPYPPLTPPRW